MNKKIYKIVIFNVGICLLIFIAFEIIVRTFLHDNASFLDRQKINIFYRPSGFSSHQMIPNRVIFRKDGKNIDSNKVAFRINSYGFRGDDFPLNKEKNEVRIFFLGGSHVFDTHAYEYDDNPGFPAAIGLKLREKGLNIRVINAGHPGHDTRHIVSKVIFDLPRFQPDIVVITSIWNDLKWIRVADTSSSIIHHLPYAIHKNPLIERVNMLDYLLGWSSLYRKMRDYYWKNKLGLTNKPEMIENIITAPNQSSGNYKHGLEQYRRNLEIAIVALKKIHAMPILALEERLASPANTAEEIKMINFRMTTVKNHRELLELYNGCDSILVDLAKKYNLLLLNGNLFMEGKKQYFVDHVHCSPAGSQFMAEFYYSKLLPLLSKNDSLMP